MAKKEKLSKSADRSSKDHPKPKNQQKSIKETNTTSERGGNTTIRKSKGED